MEVTCLVPAFKRRYLRQLLTNAHHQSLPAVRIVISDDTPGDEIIADIAASQITEQLTKRMRVVSGPKQGHHRNIEHLISIFLEEPTSHFHILNDDDLLFPEFYATHATMARRYDPVCSISRRWIADDQGFPVRGARYPPNLTEDDRMDVEISSGLIADTYLADGHNWLGELSCAVFRADYFDSSTRYCVYKDIPYFGLNDIGAFLTATIKGRVMFSNQYLGAFRRSTNSLTTSRGYAFSLAILARIAVTLVACEHQLVGFDRLVRAIEAAREQWIFHYGKNPVSTKLAELIEGGPTYADLKSGFLDYWHRYLAQAHVLQQSARSTELSERLKQLKM